MDKPLFRVSLRFEPVDNQQLAALCGPGNEVIAQLEAHYCVKIFQRNERFVIQGAKVRCELARDALQQLYDHTTDLYSILRSTRPNEKPNMDESLIIKTRQKSIRPQNAHQVDYLRNIREYDMNFAIGPAGTGKTYLAVACAIAALERGTVERLIFVRPAVEAGEKLGFLPGDMEEKVLPYLRPIYDALYEMHGVDDAKKLINSDVIEIAPLAFMRGRTLNDAFIILDEAQNTTIQQMKMFLTRLGFGSKAVITGDMTQVDLPHHQDSGLSHAIKTLENILNIKINQFEAKDAVRHPLVTDIIQAYEAKKP